MRPTLSGTLQRIDIALEHTTAATVKVDDEASSSSIGGRRQTSRAMHSMFSSIPLPIAIRGIVMPPKNGAGPTNSVIQDSIVDGSIDAALQRPASSTFLSPNCDYRHMTSLRRVVVRTRYDVRDCSDAGWQLLMIHGLEP